MFTRKFNLGQNIAKKNINFVNGVTLMKIKGLIFEDIINYKKISLTVLMPKCDFKCDRECGCQVCQNSPLAKQEDYEIDVDEIINKYYLENPIVEALVFQGLEPLDSFDDLEHFIYEFRIYSSDDVVIYTGYNEDEIKDKIQFLKDIPNITVKFGRFIPNQESKFDEVLGVTLASPNQYAVKIS